MYIYILYWHPNKVFQHYTKVNEIVCKYFRSKYIFCPSVPTTGVF